MGNPTGLHRRGGVNFPKQEWYAVKVGRIKSCWAGKSNRCSLQHKYINNML